MRSEEKKTTQTEEKKERTNKFCSRCMLLSQEFLFRFFVYKA
jgi:hypothetical protein